MLRGLLVGSGIVYSGVVALGCHFQEKLIFPAPRTVFRTPASQGWPFDKVTLPVDGETTEGWFVPLDGARGTVLFSHGNGENIANTIGQVVILRELGFNALVYDYGGYGASTGSPSETRCYDDIRAMWEYLTKTRGLPANSIVLHGRSLGGGPTTQLAIEVNPAAVILESTFRSITRMANARFPLVPAGMFLRHKFDNESKIGRIAAPLLVIHSREDGVVPYAQGRSLFEQATTKHKEFLEIRGDHNEGFIVDQKTYVEGLRTFFATVFAKQAAATGAAQPSPAE